jgi:hypothetical protein
MKKLSILMFILLSGCSAEIQSWRLNVLTEKCKEHGGISVINNFFVITARCGDGTFVNMEVKK